MNMFFSTNEKTNQAIVDDVESGGAKSLVAQALRLGDIKSESDPLLLGPAEMKAAFDELPEEDRQVLLRTKVCECDNKRPTCLLLRPISGSGGRYCSVAKLDVRARFSFFFLFSFFRNLPKGVYRTCVFVSKLLRCAACWRGRYSRRPSYRA